MAFALAASGPPSALWVCQFLMKVGHLSLRLPHFTEVRVAASMFILSVAQHDALCRMHAVCARSRDRGHERRSCLPLAEDGMMNISVRRFFCEYLFPVLQ